MNQEQIDELIKAIYAISQGDNKNPGGLEGLAISIAGDRLKTPLSESLIYIGDAIRELAEVIKNK